MGGGEKGTRGAVNQSLQRDMISKILAPLIIRRPVRAQRAHVLPQGLGRLEGRQWPALGDLASPVVLLECLGHVPRSLRIGPQVLRRHVAQYIVLRAAAPHGAVHPK
jgi:hypothetical protein